MAFNNVVSTDISCKLILLLIILAIFIGLIIIQSIIMKQLSVKEISSFVFDFIYHVEKRFAATIFHC